MTDLPIGCNSSGVWKGNPYDDRNPGWLCGGVEVDSPDGKILKWSQPEIALFDYDPIVRISYPDLVEDNHRYYLTETQKHVAKCHEIPAGFLHKMWCGLETYLYGNEFPENFCDEDLILNVKNAKLVDAPVLPVFYSRDDLSYDMRGQESAEGFAIEMVVAYGKLKAGSIIDGRREDGRGIALDATPEGGLELTMNDGWFEHKMRSEPCLNANEVCHIVINVDGGPMIVSFVVNGHFCDGGEHRQFGWMRISRQFRHINWVSTWSLGDDNYTVNRLKVHARVLMAAEAIHNFSQICDSEPVFKSLIAE
jgi:hypothetical protein